MKYILTFLIGFISYGGLLEYIEYRDYKYWNMITFKYRTEIKEKDMTFRQELSNSIVTPLDKMLSVLLKRPELGKNCLYLFTNTECPIPFLHFNVDDLKYNVYCWNKETRTDELIIKEVPVLEADKIFEEHNKSKNCEIQLQNEEKL